MSEANERALLLVGSPKGLEKSNSARLGRLLVGELEKRGWTSEAIHLHESVRSDAGLQAMLEAIDRASVVVLASPLYVDSLPAPTIHAMERIAAHRAAAADAMRWRPRLVTLINCGFLEAHQNDTCQAILRRFAEQGRLDWAGGVSIGAGGAATKRTRRAFELLAESIHLELLIPDEVESMTRKRVMPPWLYVLGGNVMWRRWAANNGVKEKLKDRPYARTDR